MIVKYTFNDNDFTQVIEEYLNDFGPFYVFNYPTAQGLDEFKKLLEKYNDYNDKYYMEKDITKEEYKEIKKKLHTILKANIIQYMTSIKPNSGWSTDGMEAEDLIRNLKYLINNIKVSIVKSVPDQWENGEVVYYNPAWINYIVM